MGAQPKDKQPLLRQFATRLAKTPYLGGSSIGAADLSLLSVIKQLGLEPELQAEVETWFARLAPPSGKPSSPTKRQSSPRKSESSPTKANKGKQGKAPGKEVKKEKKSSGKGISTENQAVGSLFTQQWPETKQIFESS